jgi:hypothetical protein
MSHARIEDVYFDQDPAPNVLRAATATAFGVPADQVGIERLDGPPAIGPVPAVRWLRDNADMPGEFPAWYSLHTHVTDLRRINAILSNLTGLLGIAAMSQAPDPDELAMHGPDGSLHLVRDYPCPS